MEINVSVWPSAIKLPGSGRGTFMNRAVDDDVIIGYDYGSIVNTYMDDQEIKTNIYGNGIMEVGKTYFEKRVVEMRHMFVYKCRIHQ